MKFMNLTDRCLSWTTKHRHVTHILKMDDNFKCKQRNTTRKKPVVEYKNFASLCSTMRKREFWNTFFFIHSVKCTEIINLVLSINFGKS